MGVERRHVLQAGQAMTFGSLFSGVGGFDLGLERSGMRCVWQVEKDAACNRVLERHWPIVERHTDVKEFNGRFAVVPDLVCGGFPCQDLSVAGWRAGLTGSRSGLWFEFARIVGDISPRWVLIENVPGLLSSGGGSDMRVIVKALADMGYGVGWRVLDAQWFGLAQRRKRVFIVGCLGDVRRAAEVLFERESLPWDSPPRREAGKDTAGSTGDGVARCISTGEPRRDDWETCTMIAQPNVAKTLNAGRVPGDPCHTLHSFPPTAFQTRIARNGRGQPKDTVDALVSSESGVHGDSKPHVAGAFGVRRLTPRECERLQGFPDDWSIGSDSARYRMLGNAVAVPVAEWIGRRILATGGEGDE